jgi:hypothetical protein
MTTLQQDNQYYIDNQDKLAKEYAGKYIVIKDKSLQGVYDTEIDAYQEAKEKFELGTFLIKPCVPKSQNETQVFHTRAFF